MICRACYRIARGRGFTRSQAWWSARCCLTGRTHRIQPASRVVTATLQPGDTDDIEAWLHDQ